MQVYRIARSLYIHDLSGEGARIYGGRWNSEGFPMLYTSATRSLALLETLVHTTHDLLPADLSRATLVIPDRNYPRIQFKNLPAYWDKYPANPNLRKYGDEFISNGENLCLLVPSVIVREEINILINPMHPDMELVEIAEVTAFAADHRLK